MQKAFSVILVVVGLGALLGLYRSGFFDRIAAPRAGMSTPVPSSEGAGVGGGAGGDGTSLTAPQAAGYEYASPQTPSSEEGLSIYAGEVPQGFTRNALSPHFGAIDISSVSAPSPYGGYPTYGQISLRAAGYGGSTTRVNVSGWRIQANRGGYFIPRAVAYYEPSGLAPENDITLGSGEYLYIYSTASPVGKNIRLNKCLGYLQAFRNAEPALPYYTCPALYRSNSEISGFTGACQDYITSLFGCGLPLDNPPVPQDDYACRDFLQRINYKGCVEKYRADSDFSSSEWWIWSGQGSFSFLDFQHDRVLLFDSRNLLVDEYAY